MRIICITTYHSEMYGEYDHRNTEIHSGAHEEIGVSSEKSFLNLLICSPRHGYLTQHCRYGLVSNLLDSQKLKLCEGSLFNGSKQVSVSRPFVPTSVTSKL